MESDSLSGDGSGTGSSVRVKDRETTGNDNRKSTSTSNASDTAVNRNLDSLFTACTAQRQKHLLAEVYFSKRDTWLIFGPVTILTLVSGLLAFLASSTIFKSSQEQFTLVVGCVSTFCTLIQSISKHTRYATRSEMHRSAASELSKLCENLWFHFIDIDLGITDTSSHDVKKDGEKTKSEDVEAGKVTIDGSDNVNASASNATNVNIDGSDNVRTSASNAEKFESHETLYKQITDACESEVPLQIEQAYFILMSRWYVARSNSSNTSTVKFKNAFKIPSPHHEMANNRALYDELHSVISNAFGWPWLILKPDVAINRAIANHIRTSEIFLTDNMNLEEDIGILCFSTFCCCLDATGWFWKCCRDRREKERKERRVEEKSQPILLISPTDDAQDQLSQQETARDNNNYGSTS